MVDLVEVELITDDLIQEFELTKGDHLFECYFDDNKIGYAVIRKKKNDNLFLIISRKYQNKGYGSECFKLLLDKTNESSICSVTFDNVKMHRIIKKNNGIEIGRNGEIVLYILKKN